MLTTDAAPGTGDDRDPPVSIRDGFASRRGDLVHHFLCGPGIRAGAVVGATEVVDDHRSTFFGEEQGVLTTDAAPGTGDDRDPPVKLSHDVFPSPYAMSQMRCLRR
ncbi:Uncharacterised protein [Mycobacteroides abscessus subsp. abscessus]|nr:Uncharacterised protein [Mycobacteroides abscessus subsp. abscessus]